MTNQMETDSKPDVATLVGGIVHDAEDLISQQLKLFQVEIKNDLHRAKEAAIPLSIGVLVCFVGVSTLAVAAGHFLSWNWPKLPLWQGLGIVGGVLVLAGAAVLLWGKNNADSLNPMPDKAVAGLQENIQWKTKT
jgi:hypothetical protein